MEDRRLRMVAIPVPSSILHPLSSLLRPWRLGVLAFISFFLASLIFAQEQTTPTLDFQQSEPDSFPQGLRSLNGEFKVKQEGENRFLEITSSNLDAFGLLLGAERGAGTSIAARIRSASTGKRFPEFGIGLSGVGGYRLWLMPAVGELQIKQEHSVLAKIPFAWTSGSWVHMQFQIQKLEDGKWQLAGKAWQEGQPAPTDWSIIHEISKEPPIGQQSLWGTPYSEKPIQFDDVRMEAL